MKKIVFSGKFKFQRLTGVQRFSEEITAPLSGLVEVVVPPRFFRSKLMLVIWENFVFPFLRKNAVKIYPCNTCSIFGANNVVVLHDVAFLESPKDFSFLFSIYYRFYVVPACKRSKKIITVSEYSKNRIVKLLGVDSDLVSVIYNGVNKSKFNSDCAPYKHSCNYFLALGSVNPRKNLSRLVKSYIRAKNLDNSLPKLVIVGGESSIFSDSLKVPVDCDIEHWGYVDDELLPGIIRSAYCLVFPSLYEGFGLPILEAMACGTPVVVSKTTSLPEVAGDAGLYFDPFDINSISDALLKFHKDKPFHKNLVERGLERAQEFDWENSSKKLIDIVTVL